MPLPVGGAARIAFSSASPYGLARARLRYRVNDGPWGALPLVEVFRYPKVTLLAMGARVSESVTFNIYNAFLVTYTVTVLGLAASVVLDALLVASVVGFVAILVAGRLSDRFGRRPVFATGAGLALVSAVPIFALVNTENAVLITLGVVVGWGLAACIMFGPEGAMFAEVFPTRVRYSGMSAVYQIGVIPTGAVAPLIGTSLVSAWSGSVWPVAVYVMAMAAISLVSVFFLPETHRRDLRDASADDATPDPALTGAGSPRRRLPPPAPTSSWSRPTTWASPTSPPTAVRSARRRWTAWPRAGSG